MAFLGPLVCVRRVLAALVLILALALLSPVLAFDVTRKDNLAVYWGQDSSGTQGGLAQYCADATIDAIPLAFVYIFFGKGNMPELDLSNICSASADSSFAGTSLADCSFLAADIKKCQAAGKIVTVSLGGATAETGFNSDSQATAFADTIWNSFLGGNGPDRPFGDAVLDGVDLDIESGKPTYYSAFVNRIRSYERTQGTKPYYLTAAPQCPFPDEFIGAALSAVPFDAIYVQFYNNYCGLNYPNDYNFETWDKWARTTFPGHTIKIYIGAPAAAAAAGQGYVSAGTLAKFATQAIDQYESFGGVMLWDASEAWANNRYDRAIKNAMVGAGSRKRRFTSRFFGDVERDLSEA